jgi:hypothetical protein
MLTVYIISLTCCLNFDGKNFKILFYLLPELETNKKLGIGAYGIVQVTFHLLSPLLKLHRVTPFYRIRTYRIRVYR